MSYYDQFKYFDPLNGKLPYWPFQEANWVASRARSVLYGRTASDIRNMAEDASQLIEHYFEQEKEASVEIIKNEGRYELLEGDEDGAFFTIKDEAHEHYDIHTSDNTSDLEALQEAISSFFDPMVVDVKDIKEFEYFAVLALWLVGDYAKTLEFRLDFRKMDYVKRESVKLDGADTVRLAQILLAAMDAVCYAERIREVERTKERYEERIQKIEKSHKPITKKDADRIRAELVQQLEEEAKAQRIQRSKENNQLRHQGNHEVRKTVLDLWEKNPTQFSSAEKAGAHYVEVLETRGITRGHRTVVEWIRARAKELNIRFR